MDITKKGTPVPTRFGTLHVGDVVRVRLYEKAPQGGTAINTREGTLVYHENEARFLLYSEEEGLSYNLNMAEKPITVKKWNE